MLCFDFGVINNGREISTLDACGEIRFVRGEIRFALGDNMFDGLLYFILV